MHEWEKTLNSFSSAVDKLDYLYGLTHYSLESGADCHVEIKKLLPQVRQEFELCNRSRIKWQKEAARLAAECERLSKGLGI